MIERLAQALGDETQSMYPHKTEVAYPRIVEKIAVLWGSPQMSKYFNELLFDDRGGRAGFPPDVMTELFRLSTFHESKRPPRNALDAAWESNDVSRYDRFGGMTKS